MEQKAGESNNDLLSSSGVTSNGVELDSPRKVIPYPGKEHIERVLEEYSHQVKDLQRRLNESNELHEKQKFYLRQSVIDLQTKLQEMQMERDAMADIRRRESQSQEDLRNQLQNTVHELEAAKCLKEDMLKDSNAQIEQLRKMMLGHEGVLQEIRSILADFEEASGKKIYEHENVSTLHFRNMGSAISKILRELDTEISYLKGRIFPNRHVGFLSNPPLIPDSSGVFCPIFQSRAMNCMRNKSFT